MWKQVEAINTKIGLYRVRDLPVGTIRMERGRTVVAARDLATKLGRFGVTEPERAADTDATPMWAAVRYCDLPAMWLETDRLFAERISVMMEHREHCIMHNRAHGATTVASKPVPTFSPEDRERWSAILAAKVRASEEYERADRAVYVQPIDEV